MDEERTQLKAPQFTLPSTSISFLVKMRLLIPLLVSLLWCISTMSAADNAKGVINIVLMGATGNLAQKYLWQSLRNIHAEGADFVVWPVATRPNMQALIDTILADNVTYPNGAKDKELFLKVVAPYQKLADSADYEKLKKEIEQRNGDRQEIGRFVYLSVPPKFFGSISKEIHTHLRPREGAWLRVIVEKPFGSNLDTALQLANDIYDSLDDKEVLCVDHYMGKDGLNGMREFHNANPGYMTPDLIKKIEKIEVQMVETEDCKGRTAFYDEVGVIRDTMQNHMMMMLTLFAMPENSKPEFIRRAELIQEMEELSTDSSSVQALGQYAEYNKEIKEDYEAYHHKAMDHDPKSKTPTYARVVLKFKKSSPFHGIPIVFTSGKNLPKRRAFLRVLFKGGREALTFNVQGELEDVSKGPAIKDAAIHATAGLAEFKCPAGWTPVNKRLCQGKKNFPNAYQVILSEALHGRFELFVTLREVLQSWRVWSPILAKNPSSFQFLTYEKGGYGLDDPMNGGGKIHQEL